MKKETPAETEVPTSAQVMQAIAAGGKPPRRNERRKARERKRWPGRPAEARICKTTSGTGRLLA